MRLFVYDMLVNFYVIYYVHVCEQARWARSAGNSAIENLCIIIIILISPHCVIDPENNFFFGTTLQCMLTYQYTKIVTKVEQFRRYLPDKAWTQTEGWWLHYTSRPTPNFVTGV